MSQHLLNTSKVIAVVILQLVISFLFIQKLSAQAPVIGSFAPTSGGQDVHVIITGSNFTDATSVSFGGTPAQVFAVTSSTTISTYVRSGSTGEVSVTTPSGTVSLAGFTYTGPGIKSFSPTAGPQGTTIIINGTNFTIATSVRFGEVIASSFTVLSDTIISAVVGAGSSGNVSVYTPLGIANLPGFSYAGPVITSFTHGVAAPGSTITINGQNFTGATSVDFGGLPATSFNVINDTTISAVNGIGYSGRITVTTPNGAGSRNGFVMLPAISSFTPAFGVAGSVVTINGINFSTFPPNNTVSFGAVKAEVVSATQTALTVIVPAGATYSPITVTLNGLTVFSSQPFILTFPGGGGPFLPSSFASKQVSQAGGSGNPFIMDLDGDSKGDIITTSTSGSFYVWKNTSVNGITSFSATNFTTGAPSTQAVSEDLNMDRRPDVVVANYGSNTISIFGNTTFNSAISFFPKISFATGINPSGVAIRDLDNDGKPDIVVVNHGSNTVSVFRNTSTPGALPFSFAPKVDFITGTGPSRVVLADFDGDGKTDMAVSHSGTNTFSVFRNTSNSAIISFEPKMDFAIASSGASIAAGDIDGDGKPDLVTGSFTNISIFRNSGSGSISFAPRLDFASLQGPYDIAIADLNGNGKPDIVTSNQSSGFVSLFNNLSTAGSISLDTRKDYPEVYAGPGIACGDLNGDGKPDIVAGTGSGFITYRNKINEVPVFTSFTPSTAVIGDSIFIYGKNLTGLTGISIGGIPLDSITVLTDTTVIIILEAETSGAIELINQWGSASLPGLSITPLPRITSFTPGSGPIGTIVTINGNNFNPSPASNIVFFGAVRATVLTANISEITVAVPKGASYEQLYVIANNLTAYSNKPFLVTFPGALPAFTPGSFSTKIDSIYGTSPIGITLSDLDGDGRVDLEVGGRSGLAIWRNVGDSGVIAFARKNSYNSTFVLSEISIIDINRDGKPDIANCTQSYLTPALIYKNISTVGNISLNQETPLTQLRLSNFYPCSADLDQDGKPDIVLSGGNPGEVAAYRNLSKEDTIRFGKKILLQTQGRICIRDIDGDGKPDLIGYSGTDLFVSRNLSTPGYISFEHFILFIVQGAGTYIENLSVGDLDGDGRPDLVAANENKTISIRLNTSIPGAISFAPQVIYAALNIYSRATIGDLDGDGKPEIVVAGYSGGKVSVFKNACSPGNVSFLPRVDYAVGIEPTTVAIGDLDGDGKPDLSVTNHYSSTVSFLRNKIGEPPSIRLCPTTDNAVLTSDIAGASYQWQVDTANGFVNISNGPNYSGTNTITLQLTTVPSSWNGYRYRCVVDGTNSYVLRLEFGNYWLGTVSTAWETAANWSCGIVPDSNTDVIIAAGSVIVLNSNITIKTLTIRPGAQLTVSPGYTLTVTN